MQVKHPKSKISKMLQNVLSANIMSQVENSKFDLVWWVTVKTQMYYKCHIKLSSGSVYKVYMKHKYIWCSYCTLFSIVLSYQFWYKNYLDSQAQGNGTQFVYNDNQLITHPAVYFSFSSVLLFLVLPHGSLPFKN